MRYWILSAAAIVAVALTGYIDDPDRTITFWHVALAWFMAGAIGWGLAIVFHRSDIHMTSCPECEGEGSLAFVGEQVDDRMVVTCHGYFWSVSDRQIMELATADRG